jgi:hypothetical protein
MHREPNTWDKSFVDYVTRADIGRALKAHYDDHQLEGQPLAGRLAVLLKKIDELENREWGNKGTR